MKKAVPTSLESSSRRAVRRPAEIGAVLRRYRRELKLSQQGVADRAGIRQATVSAIEAGDEGVSLKTLALILAALDLELVIRPRSEPTADPAGPDSYDGLW